MSDNSTMTDAEIVQNSIDTLWTLLAAFLVFFMQAGFGMLEAGVVGEKNQTNILIKNIIDCAVAGLGFWLIGYGFAFGDTAGGFIGTTKFAIEEDHASWVFQWAFAATAATIVSGSVAERCQLIAYTVYTCWITVFVYPVVVHWSWGGGWLGTEMNPAFSDFAGSGVVHMTGGTAALIGAICIGPRLNRFKLKKDSKFLKEIDQEYPTSSINMATLGTFILWFGWYGFNCGSTGGLYGKENADTASLAAMNTTLSPVAAVLTQSLIAIVMHVISKGCKKEAGFVIRLEGLLVAALGGLVGITAGCNTVGPSAAIFIGIVSSLVATGSKCMLHLFGVDDPLDAVPVHMFCGIWGVLAVGIFGADASGSLFATQLAGAAVIFGWTAVLSLVVFVPLRLMNMLRVTKETEALGLDYAKHGKKEHVDPMVHNVKKELAQLRDIVTSPVATSKVVPRRLAVPETDLEAGASAATETPAK